MFTTRNLFYLKISKDIVLPLYVYLDQQHVHWMSDRVLQCVLRDLKPLQVVEIALEGDEILHLGSKSTKATVEVVRGDDYQFAFFFRRLEQHSVLVKSRNFRVVPKAIHPSDPDETTMSQSEVIETAIASANGPAGKRGKKRARPVNSDEDVIDDIQTSDNPPARRSRISRRKFRKVQNDNDGIDEPESDGSAAEDDPTYIPEEHGSSEDNAEEPSSRGIKTEDTEVQLPPLSAEDTIPINVDEEEKPKMAMTLSYNSHYIQGRYLCVVVEPYPPLPSEQIPSREPEMPPEVRFRPPPAIPRLRDPSEIPASSRAGSVRSETPLFLPEDEEDRISRGSPLGTGRNRTVPPVASSHQSQKGQSIRVGEKNAGDLFTFSQALTNLRHEEEGDDSDEDYLRGDADEAQRVIE